MNAPASTAIVVDWTWVVAAYGAIVATLVLIWDIWKWVTAGPRLSASLSTGMVAFNIPRYTGKTLMMLNATNRGDRPTTITHMTMHQYANRWGYLRRRAIQSWFVPDPTDAQAPPFVLQPGAVWTGIAEQSSDIETMSKGLLYVGLIHSHSRKEMRFRVVIKAAKVPSDRQQNN